jgi:hypothetical protein
MTRLLTGLVAASFLFGQPRPKVLGVARMAVYVKDLAKARQFYEELLEFAEPFTLPNKSGAVRIAFLKVNDHHYFELSTSWTVARAT